MPTTLIRLETKKLNIKIVELLEDIIALHVKAAKAVNEMDVKVAFEVLADDKIIDAKYLDIEADLEFMVTKAPVDKDLRRTLAYLSISKELERIGDYAKHMAKFVIKIEGKAASSSKKRISEVHKLILAMLKELVKVLNSEKFDDAIALAKKDRLVNEKLAELRMEIVASVAKKGDKVQDIDERIYVLNTIERLERAGDHIVKICGMIAYINNGQHIFLE